MKENIRIRVKGFGWSDLSHPWSKNGVAYTPQELGKHLKKIIKIEKSRKIPERPPIPLPQRMKLPQLGTLTSDVKGLDASNHNETVDFEGGTNITTARSGNKITITNGVTNNNQLTNGAGYTTNTGTTTASNTQTFTNKSGNISQWTNLLPPKNWHPRW